EAELLTAESVLAEPEHHGRRGAGEFGRDDVADPGEVRVGPAAAGEGPGAAVPRLGPHAVDRVAVAGVVPAALLLRVLLAIREGGGVKESLTLSMPPTPVDAPMRLRPAPHFDRVRQGKNVRR